MIFDKNIYEKTAEVVAKMHSINYDALTAKDLAKYNKKPFIFPKIYELYNLVEEDYIKNNAKK